ncbi:M23 family metallopeptidase [bacterium]|nr:M23 family metallopeptidase [bacterium]
MKTKIHSYKKKRQQGSRLFLILFILFSLSVFLLLSFIPKEKSPPQKKEATPIEEKEPSPSSPLETNHVFIKRGMTLTDILSPYHFSPKEIHKIREEVQPVYDLSKIKAGKEMRIYCLPDGGVERIEYDMDEEKYLCIDLKEESCQAQLKKFPFQVKEKMILGVIQDNLISAINEQGEKVFLALSLAEIFAWDIDFYIDIQPGDSFKIIFEKKFLDGEFKGYGNILAAEFINQGKKFQAFRYTYPDTGKSDYFDFQGNSLRKEFLKSPLKFGRITSRFSHSRFHPILKVYRPHHGVDYGAPPGTPVQSTADGTVIFKGWKGGSGRMVKIRHRNDYQTYYLHLSRFARGIRRGASVKSGQVIGYVGSSGLSTGPHLDYRIKYKGRFINPLAWRFKSAEPLRKEFLSDFQKKTHKYLIHLQAPSLFINALTFGI